MKFGQNINLDEIWGWDCIRVIWGQKLGQIIEKLCEDNRGHSFHMILMKYGQNVYLDNI
jgi:hypothetical protein